MASTLLQLSSQSGSSLSTAGAAVPAWLPPNQVATSVAVPPYLMPGAPSPGYTIPFIRFQKASGVFANGDFIDDLLMPQGMGFPAMWTIVDYTVNATPALAANLTLGQVGQDASFSNASLNAVQSISSGLATTLPNAALTTPPYIVNNQAAPFLRFSQQQALATNQVVVDLVMPNGHQNPGSFYVVRYVLNASLQLT